MRCSTKLLPWLALSSLLACKDGGVSDGGIAETSSETGSETDGCGVRPIAAPSARAEIEGVWDAARGRMVFFAGDRGTPVECMSQTDFVDELWAFHTDCNEFERLRPRFAGPTPRGRHALALDAANDRVLIHGGRHRVGDVGDYTVFENFAAYNMADNDWTSLPAGAGPSARSGHAAVVAGDRMILYGGNSSDDDLDVSPLGDTWAYGLQGDGWSQLQTSGDPPARQLHAMAAAPDGPVYMFGGSDENELTGPFFRDLWALDPDSGVWSQLDDGSGPPGMTSADLLYDGERERLILWGGYDDGPLGNTNGVWIYALAGGAWSQAQLGDAHNQPAAGACDFPADFVTPDLAAPERRHAGAAVITDAGELLIFGGKTDCGLIDDVWSLSLADGTWIERSPATVGESCLRASADCQTMCD